MSESSQAAPLLSEFEYCERTKQPTQSGKEILVEDADSKSLKLSLVRKICTGND